MKDLFIGGTTSTPEVNFKTNGELQISGKSIPSNATTLFEPVLNWIKEYNGKNTILSMKMEYFNTSTSKILYDILKILEEKHNKSNFIIKWYYEEGDEDVLDTGQYYKSLMGTPFEFFVMSEYEMMNI